MLDWHQHIAADPQVMYGKPCIKGTRIPVDLILDKLASGQTIEDLLGLPPRESIQACLQYGADSVRKHRPPFAS
ncbi:MAG: DUF433 domain-containing protein [Flavobacteriales bacterium]|nr:DUF433 domain-containing protein [Flavobacteriales bacterium]